MHDDAFCYLLRVRYGEVDAQKVVFNARYGDYIDIACNEYLRAVWGDPTEMFNQDIDYQLVRQTIEWKSAARFDEVVAVRVETGRIGTTSFALEMEFRELQSQRLIATAETVYVLVSASRLEKIAIPEEYRRRLEKGARGVVVDHAGARARRH